MRHHIDQDALVGPMHELGNENEVPRGRNGQEFGDALHHGKDDDLFYRHGPLAAQLVRRARRFYPEPSPRSIHLILNTWPPTARWRLFYTILSACSPVRSGSGSADAGVGAGSPRENPWEWRAEFPKLSPAGPLPLLLTDAQGAISGSYAISEYLGDTMGERSGVSFAPFPGDAAARAEARRLPHWVHRQFFEEVASYLVEEKVFRRFGPQSASPDMEAMRAGRNNLRYHLTYIGHLTETRSWLAGDALSFADLAAAAP